MAGSAVEVLGVTSLCDDEPVLLDLRLRLAPGSLTVLLGRPGAGKTLLVRHVVGLTAPGAGTVLVDGTDVWGSRPEELVGLRRRTGVMLGGATHYDASLFGSLTAADNIRAGLAERGVDEAERDRRCGRLLHDLRLAPWAHDLPEAMPAHARRRLAVARARATEAPLVVLDGLVADDALTGPVLPAVREHAARGGATVLVTTHDLAVARALGGRLAVLWHGRIVGEGDPADLLRGIEDERMLEARFGAGDLGGPPTLEQARQRVDADDGPRTRRIEFDGWVVHVVVAALIAIAALGALYLAGLPR